MSRESGMRGGDEQSIANLWVQIGSVLEDEAGEVAEATLGLRRELLELDVENVELRRIGEPPPGTRAIDFVALGGLIVGITKSGILTSIVGAVQSWLGSHPQRSVRLELDGDVLDLTGVSSEDQRRLTQEWLLRHPVQQ
jgi:hypothetical protein